MGSIIRRFARNKTAMIGFVIFMIIFLGCILANLYMDYQATAIKQNINNAYTRPSLSSIFGTDHYGRSLFARILFGGRTSLVSALVVIIISTVIGAIVGAIAGYYGGVVDNIVMRVNDIFYSIPYTLMAICIAATLGGGMVNLCLACVVAVTPGNIRMFRAWIMPLKESDYIEAARAYGTRDRRILLRHIIPNTLGPIIVQATLNLAGTIIAVAGLSYIGLGVQSPTPEWGAMLSEAREHMRDYPYLVIYPGLAILVSTLSLNLVGDGLRDALDPRLKN
jgi:peptide/nickel transport system permease protein